MGQKHIGRQHIGTYARRVLYVIAFLAFAAPIMERQPHKKVGEFFYRMWGKHL